MVKYKVKTERSMKCISCGEELVFFKGKLMCKSCNKEWNQLIVDDKEYYDIDLKDSMNAIFAFEYEKLFELLRKQQIYGVLLQIKDIYEVMLKLPVLMTSAIIFNNNEISESDKVILINMINGKNSMGDWNDFASKLKKSMMIRNTPLFKILKDTTSFINSYNCIKWRNETIGHGPTKEIEDDFLYTDIIEKIKCITKFFKDTLDLYDQIPLLLKSEEQTYVLKGYDNAITKKEGSLFVRINDVIYNLDPFIYKVGDGLFFFDNYIASKRYLDIIEYPRGKRDIKYTGKFEDFKDNDQFASKATDELIAQTEVDISSNILNIDDFIEPKYVYNWIIERINNNDKVSFLLFEKGMGKSTLVNFEKADNFPHWQTNNKKFHAERVKGSRKAYKIVEDK